MPARGKKPKSKRWRVWKACMCRSCRKLYKDRKEHPEWFAEDTDLAGER